MSQKYLKKKVAIKIRETWEKTMFTPSAESAIVDR
jgi:hypothetical protein